MFHKTNQNTDLKSETDRLWPPPTSEASASNQNERITLTPSSHSRQYHNCSGNNSKEDSKSHRLWNSNFNSLSQQRSYQTTTNQQEMDPNSSHYHNNSNLNQRNGQNLHRSTTNPQLNQNPSFQHPIYPPTPAPSTTSSKSAFSKEFSAHHSIRRQQQMNQQFQQHQFKPRSSSVTTISYLSHLRELDQKSSAHSPRRQEEPAQHQKGVSSDEVLAAMDGNKEGLLEIGSNGFKDVELQTLGSLERELPVELSFLIRQQAYCMARMNYLDRQIRELKDSRHATPNTLSHSTNSTPINQSQHANRTTMNPTTTTTTSHAKNGNFILSDDSGGEYSRATISDDDELSSLLDQIAKSVKPERNMNQINVNNNNGISNIGNSQTIRSNYGVVSNQPQQYAILNPNQLHHHHHQAAVPVFFMSPSIAMAHPSSINSSVLPGVHFQSEPRYNQYYDDLYAQNNNSSTSAMHSRHDGVRAREFDSSIAAIEQLVSQKERRQIKSQLKSADNWLKMRSSGLCNLNDNFSSNINNIGTGVAGSMGERNHLQPVTSSSVTIATDNNVIEESRRSR